MADNDIQSGVPQLYTPFVQTNLQIAVPWYRFLITLWNRTGGSNGSGSSGGSSVLTGTVSLFAYNSIPANYLLCNGAAVSRDVFLSLFQRIGTTWGAGDGVNTFNLPNLIDRFVLGAASAGEFGGSSSLILSIAQLPPHAHEVSDPGHTHSLTDPGHSHGQQVVNSNTAGASGSQGASTANATSVGSTDSAETGLSVETATTGVTTENTGGGEPISLLPSYATLVPAIKT